MNGAPDLREFLNSWPYDPGNNVRLAHGANGREIILVRQPMGMEICEVDGRPDGQHPHGMESALEFQLTRFAAAIRAGAEAVFQLAAADCTELFHEGTLYHDRLVHFFRVRNWACAERDTARNLRLMDFVKQHAEHDEDRVQLEHWRPATTRIKAVARAMILLQSEQYQEALHITRDIVATIDGTAGPMPDQPGKLADALLESIRESLAHRPTLCPHAESAFIREGDYWTIRYQGHAAILKATRGLDCLRYLLRHPGREIHVSELLASLPDASAAASAVHASGSLFGDGGQFIIAGLNDTGPVLDAQAKAEYKCRLNELRQDAEEAERFNDPVRAAKAHDEMDGIARQLAAAVGLGGRDRRAASEADRARSAATKRIKEAIHRIAEAIPPLGHHLAARIKTGYFCSYNPHPDRPVAWKF